MRPEQFKPVPWAPKYMVSSNGRVIKLVNKTHPERHQSIDIAVEDNKGTLRVKIAGGHETISRLVYLLFVGPLVDGMVICHLDGDHRNNSYTNLYQGTQKENISHKKIHGTWQSCEKHPRASVTNDVAVKIRKAIEERRTATGRLKKGEAAKIARACGAPLQAVYNISRTRSGYTDLVEI